MRRRGPTCAPISATLPKISLALHLPNARARNRTHERLGAGRRRREPPCPDEVVVATVRRLLQNECLRGALAQLHLHIGP